MVKNWKFIYNKENHLFYCLHKNSRGLWEIAYKTESKSIAEAYVIEMITIDNDKTYLPNAVYF